MRNNRLLRGPTSSQCTSSKPSRVVTRSITFSTDVLSSSSIARSRKKVGASPLVQQAFYDTFRGKQKASILSKRAAGGVRLKVGLVAHKRQGEVKAYVKILDRRPCHAERELRRKITQ